MLSPSPHEVHHRLSRVDTPRLRRLSRNCPCGQTLSSARRGQSWSWRRRKARTRMQQQLNLSSTHWSGSRRRRSGHQPLQPRCIIPSSSITSPLLFIRLLQPQPRSSPPPPPTLSHRCAAVLCTTRRCRRSTTARSCSRLPASRTRLTTPSLCLTTLSLRLSLSLASRTARESDVSTASSLRKRRRPSLSPSLPRIRLSLQPLQPSLSSASTRFGRAKLTSGAPATA